MLSAVCRPTQFANCGRKNRRILPGTILRASLQMGALWQISAEQYTGGRSLPG